MGIKDLWTILGPYCERKPLYELQGKVVAIDLAGWICESLCVVDYEVQAKNYLKNLFYRTRYLLLFGVTPVFVMEGDAPDMKARTMSQRQQMQFRGARPRKVRATEETSSVKRATNKGRRGFNMVLQQCAKLLKCMGLQCVKGRGEAEAYCAQLNAAKLVDGVISQDSDCFAYGAIRVYRNFSLSSQGGVSSSGGAVDVYDMDVIRRTFDIGQNQMIAMALLCGCDYCPEGVGGVGKDAVCKLFNIYSDDTILETMKSWRLNNCKYTALELKIEDKTICVNCGHYGRAQKHIKSGCDLCKMASGCDASRWKEQRLSIKAELQIRKKCIEIDDFPSQDIIDEFKQAPIEITGLDLDWKQPDLNGFFHLMRVHLQWLEIYCFQKMLPVLTRWQLFHFGNDSHDHQLRGCVQPDFIKKKRAPKGVVSYEIIWKDEQNYFNGLIPNDQLEEFLSDIKFKDSTEGMQSLWSTIEPIDLVENAYPDLVETFLGSKKTKSKGTTKKTNGGAKKKSAKSSKLMACTSLEDMSALTDVISEMDSQKKPAKKTRKDHPVKESGLQRIESFFRPLPQPYESPKIKTSTTPISLAKLSNDLSDLDDEDWLSDDDENLSQVIQEIVSRPPEITHIAGRMLRFDQVDLDKFNDIENWGRSTDSKDNQGLNDSLFKSPQAKRNCVDDSLDDFDLLVMKKSITSRQTSEPLKDSNSAGTSTMNSSTPVLVNRFLTKHNLQARNLMKNRSQRLSKSEDEDANQNDENESPANVSSFFCNSFELNNQMKCEFERSVDFKNMDDEIIILSSDSESSDDE